MKDYKHLHRPNPYSLPNDNALEERILNWGSLIVGVALIALLVTGVIA